VIVHYNILIETDPLLRMNTELQNVGSVDVLCNFLKRIAEQNCSLKLELTEIAKPLSLPPKTGVESQTSVKSGSLARQTSHQDTCDHITGKEISESSMHH
jgi:hypothetical protein